MKINRNMSAVISNQNLRRTENRLQQSIERLSSGLKLNSAKDNPAGMAISNKMKAQIDALNKANDNANDGISVVQIADGALNEVASVLQRIRELSVQAASESNTYDDKKAMQREIDQLTKEVDRISTDTEYNTKKLLDGSSDTRIYSSGVSRVNISDTVPSDTYQITVGNIAKKASDGFTVPTSFSADGSVSINGVSIDVKAGMTRDEFMYRLDEAATEAGTDLDYPNDGTGSLLLYSTTYGENAVVKISVSASIAAQMHFDGNNYNADTGMHENEMHGLAAKVELGNGFSNNATFTTDGNRVYIRDSSGFTMDFLMNEDLGPDEVVDIDVTDIGRMTVQIGANQYQEMDIRIPEISAKSLYLDTVDVTITNGAGRAISTLDDAIAKMSSVRSSIGAFQNRLEYASGSLAETEENMTAAYSQILDTDMAEEMTEYAQQNILDQAGISVLSQANDLPQQVLSLLSR